MSLDGLEDVAVDLDEDASEAQIRSTWQQVRDTVSGLSLGDLRSGTWFAQLLAGALRGYTKSVTADWMREKYPSLPLEAVVDRRVALAQRYAMLTGGASASAYTVAVALTIGSAGGASPLTIPAAVASLAADLFFVSMLQLRLAWDLAVLYGHPLDLDDPEDVYDLLMVAFGIKTGEAFHSAVAKLAPEATRVAVKRVATGATLHWLKALPVVGKHLLQRNLIKGAIPLIAVPLSAGLNYYFTGVIARTARTVFRKRALVPEEADAAAIAGDASPLLALRVAYLVLRVDGVVTKEESRFLQTLSDLMEAQGLAASDVVAFRNQLDPKKEDVLRELGCTPTAIKQGLYEVAVRAAAVDGTIHRREDRLLREIARCCEIEYDRKHAREAARR